MYPRGSPERNHKQTAAGARRGSSTMHAQLSPGAHAQEETMQECQDCSGSRKDEVTEDSQRADEIGGDAQEHEHSGSGVE